MDTVKNENGEPLRGAIVGFGNAAVYAHLPAWQMSEHFKIDAVVEPDRERADIAGELLPGARVYAAVDELLDSGKLDFIDVCTPPCYHVDLVVAACKSKLHVFCEKPLAVSLENLHRMQAMADLNERVVFTVNNWKYAPLWVKTTELVRAGEIGSLRSISLNVLRPPNSGGGASDWRKCLDIAWGGILIDHGWHNLYVLLTLLQEPPVLVSARMETSGRTPDCCEEAVDLSVLFPDAEARLHLTWRASCRRNFGEIVGDKGTIFVNDDHIVLDRHGKSSERFDFAEALSAGSHHPEWMAPVIENFHREIKNVHERGGNLMEAQWCTQLIQLAYQSNREASRPIKLLKPESMTLAYCA